MRTRPAHARRETRLHAAVAEALRGLADVAVELRDEANCHSPSAADRVSEIAAELRRAWKLEAERRSER